MSATSITLSSLSSISIESIGEDIESPKLKNTNELSELEDENDTEQLSKASHRKPALIIFLLILGLTLIIAIALQADKSPPKTKFLPTTTLFYNMTFPPSELITSTTEKSFCSNHDLWISDGQCDDESNTIDCQYDGGDCCLPNSTLIFCMKCICHLTGHRHYEMATEREERVLVVIGGRIIESSFENNSTEVIFESNDLANQFFVSYPHDRVETCGGLVDYRIIVCGGIEDNGGMGSWEWMIYC